MCRARAGQERNLAGHQKVGKQKGIFTGSEVSDFLPRMEHHLVDVLDV